MTDQCFDYDVVVVGAGNAACSAALAGLDQNARIGILEKAPKRDRGGNSALTGQMRFVYNNIDDLRPLIKNISEADPRSLVEWLPHRTEAEIWDDAMRVTDNQADQDMLQVHVTESLRTVHWLAGKGHDWVPTGLAGIAVDNIVLMNGGGYGLQQRHFAIMERGGAFLHYETAATELIQDQQGRVYPPKSNYSLSIEEPPFEAWPVRCGITFTFGGLRIDPKTGQVQHVAGRPVAGLYAAGEMVGGLFVGNYASGSGMMAGATFGRIAGTHAALGS